MTRLLYITDREEYSKHNFIGPLFEKYLPEYMSVETVYFTKYKSCSQSTGNRHVVPEHEKTNLFQCLQNNGVDVEKFDMVIVRNMHDVLEYVLNNRVKYNFKVGYRISFPKITGLLERARSENRATLFQILEHKLKTYTKSKLINRCDVFLPTSKQMQEMYYPDVRIKIFTIPSAIDPAGLKEKNRDNGEKTVFIHKGTLSKLRDFEEVLEAFCLLDNDNWIMKIYTKDVKYATEMIKSYPSIQKNIFLYDISDREELTEYIADCDIGLAMLPDISIFNTSVALKIMDYYSNSVPALMTNSAQNSMIFDDGENGWLCDFDRKGIKGKLEEILKLPKEKFLQVGKKGQERLLQVRNYKNIASNLAKFLKSL